MSAAPIRDDDSAFADLLGAIAGDRNDIAVLIQSFFDESWNDDILCVAGYIFKSANARKLDAAWRRMLFQYKDLPYFRMSACNSGGKPFDRLDDKDRIALQTHAIKLIGKYASYGSAVTIDQKAFYKVIGEHGFVRSPYEQCTWIILSSVMTWINDHPYVTGAGYFFEAGHQNQAQSNALMNVIFDSPVTKAAYRYNGHAFVEKEKSRPSQAADLLSWQWFKDCTRRMNGMATPRADCLALMRGTQHHVMHLSEATMQGIMDWFDAKAGGSGGREIAASAMRHLSSLLRGTGRRS